MVALEAGIMPLHDFVTDVDVLSGQLPQEDRRPLNVLSSMPTAFQVTLNVMLRPATHLHLNRRWPCDVLSGQLPQDRRREFHVFEVKDGRQQMLAFHDDVEAVAQLLSLFGCLPPHFQWRLPPCAEAARVSNALRMAPCSTKSS